MLLRTYRRLRSVISHHRLPLSLCCACCVMRAVSRASGARREKRKGSLVIIWSNGHDAQFGFDGESSSLAEFMSIFVSTFFFCIVYVTQTPQTTQTTDSTRAVQGACYNQLATTLYTPAACQQSRKQHHTRAVLCPRCINAVASYLILGWFRYRTLRSVGLRVCCCVMHAATGTPTQIFHNVI